MEAPKDLMEAIALLGFVLTRESGTGVVKLVLEPAQLMAIKNCLGSKYQSEFIAQGITFCFEPA